MAATQSSGQGSSLLEAALGSADDEALPPVDQNSLLRHPSDDGTEIVEDGAEERFEKWLVENGGTHPKILFPSRETVQGVRGTVALADIYTNEPMLTVPKKLMISPPRCRSDENIGYVFNDNPGVFGSGDDDKVLSVFLMYEKARGAASFWEPYLAMLPMPGSVSEWSRAELDELQDPKLAGEVEWRPRFQRQTYERLMEVLVPKYPDVFDAKIHTFEVFRWAWMTIQARAFGRRLPWTALVPFADCLNHGNYQTKYDYDVAGNGVFRLFPTGSNYYRKGGEVFNSYGRRDNRFLLLEYGFALPDNEWDTCQVTLRIGPPPGTESSRQEGAAGRGGGTAGGGAGGAGGAGSTSRDDKEEEEEEEEEDKAEAEAEVMAYRCRVDLLRRFYMQPSKTAKVAGNRLCTDALTFLRVLALDLEDFGDEKPSSISRFSVSPISNAVEARALAMLRGYCQERLAAFPTTLATDEAALAELPADCNPRASSALHYRLGMKRALVGQVALLDALLPLVAFFARQEAKGLPMEDPHALRYPLLQNYVGKCANVAMDRVAPKEPLYPPAPGRGGEDDDDDDDDDERQQGGGGGGGEEEGKVGFRSASEIYGGGGGGGGGGPVDKLAEAVEANAGLGGGD